jgi:hypothetical protein
MADESDAEARGPVDTIRHAERLIRAEHHILADDWRFWGQLADHLNDIAHIPELIPGAVHDRDWRAFNRAVAMASGYIRMSAARNAEGAGK